MRNRFDQQLMQLNVELVTMGALCEEALTYAIRALFQKEEGMITRTLEAEDQINQKEKEIEGICMKLLLQQQPVARDLRIISSALKMISDMERIGDQAADIAEIVKEFTFFKPKYNIDYNGWHVDGDWFEWDYTILNSAGQSIASVSKELWNWTDTYVIDVHNPQDALYALMLVLAIDAEKCSRKD